MHYSYYSVLSISQNYWDAISGEGRDRGCYFCGHQPIAVGGDIDAARLLVADDVPHRVAVLCLHKDQSICRRAESPQQFLPIACHGALVVTYMVGNVQRVERR